LLGGDSSEAPSDDEQRAAIIEALMNQAGGNTLSGLGGGGLVGGVGVVGGSGLVMRGGGVGHGPGPIAISNAALAGSTAVVQRLGASSSLETQAKTSGKKPVAPTRITLVSLKAQGLTVDATSGVFDRNDRAIRACYETLLETVTQAEGSLGLEIVVAKDGHVTKVGVTKATGHTPLDVCVVDVVTRMSFAKPTPIEGKDTIVSVELAFRRPPASPRTDE
jgi:TonB family protein